MRLILLVLLLAACGSTAKSGGVTILSAPCVAADGGFVATFTLPASFDPMKGDTLTGSVCAPACGDGGGTCDTKQPQGEIPRGGTEIRVECHEAASPNFGSAMCPGNEAFLQIVE
jgi:hypothetical protein